MRDRLIEILSKPIYPKEGVNLAEVIADYLLDNGVIVPPCKVGDTVWFVRPLDSKKEITETTIEKMVVKGSGVYMKLACNAMYETSCNSIGKTVFLTREEAEAALAGEGGKHETD